MMLILTSTLIMSTLIALSTQSWIIIWMMLEMNLMTFLPIMNNLMYKTNFLFKYFIVQTTSSSTFLLSIMMMWAMQFNNQMINFLYLEWMVSLSMMLKMGLIPFHWWYIEIMMSLSWMNIFLMSTWQKIIPLTIISYFKMNSILYLSIILSSLISSLQGINQINLRKLFTMSSINQTSWMTINSTMSLYLMLTYLMLYTMISFNIFFLFNWNKFSYIHEIYLMNNIPPLIYLFLMLNILSLAGMPPLLGFIMKFISIKFMMKNMMYSMILFLMLSSMFTLYYYLKVAYSSMILMKMKNKTKFMKLMLLKNNKKKMSNFNKIMYTFSMINLIMIPIMSLIIN
uniref:NADH-ubiquinone oxidoreductase chain 2 n=1 Tax=Janus compressus TaxID=1385266 RepID=A0A1W6Q5B2_9HYME|nr:NADH dehydrogenase subunit 2 [Janus compressus]